MMIERTQLCFDLKPAYLPPYAYGSAETLHWIVDEKKIAPHIPVIDKSEREDGISRRSIFRLTRSATFTSEGRITTAANRWNGA